MSEIKLLTAAHLPAVIELDQLCFGGIWTLEGYQRELLSPNSDMLVISVPSDSHESAMTERLVGIGCSWAILDEAHITLLGIHPNYRRQGLGQMLLQALLKTAQERGLKRATLEVRASNQSALSLYHKFGFQEAGRRKKYYQDTNEDALVLWRGGLETADFQKPLNELIS